MTGSGNAVSRRQVARGAAWSVPVVAAATTVPAVAVSHPDAVICPAVNEIGVAGVVSLSAELKGSGGYQSYFTLSAGEWNMPAATTASGEKITGYYLNWGTWGGSCSTSPGTTSGHALTMTGSDGKSYRGDLTLSTPTRCSPQTSGSGLAVNLGIQTEIPYDARTCQVTSPAAVRISCISIPFTLTYLVGLDDQGNSSSNHCQYLWNVCFDVSGCFPFTSPATRRSISSVGSVD